MRNNRFPPDPKPGDLVDVRYRDYRDDMPMTQCGALVLEYYCSNIYESASCQLFHDGEISWANVRDITVVTYQEDVKKA
jgi:hypothetical protein